MYNGHVPQVPSGALRLLLLPETAEEGHLQRAGRQTLLPRLFRPPLRLNFEPPPPHPHRYVPATAVLLA